MSRCYPYPPRAYAGKCASNEALICTIKLQRESIKTKTEKKDRRKEKKEKKREDKSNGAICNEKKILEDEKLYHARKVGYPEAHCQTKLQATAYDSMEKSSLTEEQGRPCNSSESTENSRKRKQLSPPLATNNARNPGTVIRIVLNQGKKEDRPTPSSSNNASLSLPTGKVNSLSQKADVEVKNSASKLRIMPPNSNPTKADVEVKNSASKLCITPPKSKPTQQLTIISSNKEKLPCTDRKIDQVPTSKDEKKEKLPCPDKKIDQVPTRKDEKKLPRPLRKYKALFENWVPSSMDLEPVDEEEDWLLGKKEVCQTAKRMKCSRIYTVFPNCGNPGMQPQAHFLSDIDIYALPFTAPF